MNPEGGTAADGLELLFRNNRAWAAQMIAADPRFFSRLVKQQAPRWLWIGCSDSRVPANQIVGLAPGEVFVHRNVANLVQGTDLNCMAVLQFAVEVLHVEHIVVCGHYDCGGVKAALAPAAHGLIDDWIRSIRQLCDRHADALAAVPPELKADVLCELNVIEQVRRLAETSILGDAWSRGFLQVHGLVYDVADGLLRDLDVSLTRGQVDENPLSRAARECLERRTGRLTWDSQA